MTACPDSRERKQRGVSPQIYSGGIAMKKISAKQLLVNAMKEYGNNLILENRI